MKKYAFIGDIHSQGQPLAAALAFVRHRGLTPIFLGDLFDSRCDTSDSVWVYHQVKLAQTELNGIVLNSNHQDRLLKFLYGTFEDPSFTSETWRTLNEFENAGLSREKLIEWLESFHHGFIFHDSRGQEFRCSHAYFPVELASKVDENGFVDPETDSQKVQMLWGIFHHQRRIKWWKKEAKHPWVRVAGHYHTVCVNEKQIVLDANCGYEGGELPVYDVEAQELVLFNESSREEK